MGGAAGAAPKEEVEAPKSEVDASLSGAVTARAGIAAKGFDLGTSTRGGVMAGVLDPKVNGDTAGEKKLGVGAAATSPKNEGIFAGGASIFGVTAAAGGSEKKSADAEAATNAGTAVTGAGLGLGIVIAGRGATTGETTGGAEAMRLSREGISGAGVVDKEAGAETGKLNDAGKTIGGSLILSRSPSSTGGRSSSRAENTREDVV